MRQFRRLQRIRLKTSATRTVPADFMARKIAAHAAHPWAGYSDASIVHHHSCAIRRGETCTCVPDVLLHMPGGQIVSVRPAASRRKPANDRDRKPA
jgi:hypothetical protein